MMRRGLAIVNMLIYVVIFSILSGMVLGVLSSSTRELEKSVRHTKGYYAAEAGNVFALDVMRRTGVFPVGPSNIVWSYNIAGVAQTTKPVTNVAGAGMAGTMSVASTNDYTVNW